MGRRQREVHQPSLCLTPGPEGQRLYRREKAGERGGHREVYIDRDRDVEILHGRVFLQVHRLGVVLG
ncbi:unnamed protein product [Linum tenue]|uniref:Uncharacterized protein n=1 Tax=Linum tenue TaxID=586396 RepID=A0AAV0H5I4_9ROSI|nr:unnamed protein product [Linum tenue]